MSEQKLTDDEISRIIHRAAEIEGSGASIDRAILERTASELGISPEAVKQAEAELRQSGQEQADRAIFKKSKWHEFYEHLASYVAVNGFLTFIDMRKDGDIDWVLYPILGWGIAMFIHFVTMFRGLDDPEVEKEFRKWQKAKNKKRKSTGT